MAVVGRELGLALDFYYQVGGTVSDLDGACVDHARDVLQQSLTVFER
ncbi:hypothetical protein [Streptomyces xiamenensis]